MCTCKQQQQKPSSSVSIYILTKLALSHFNRAFTVKKKKKNINSKGYFYTQKVKKKCFKMHLIKQ